MKQSEQNGNEVMISEQTTTNNSEYRDGYPDMKGWYECLIDDEPIKLYCFICELDRRKRYWITERQEKVIGERVLWKATR